jgi:hypothetical protein
LGFVQQAFGANLATELFETYNGSSIVTDNKQDLVGAQYLAKQIQNIEEDQRRSSVIERYSYLLYEGEKCEAPAFSQSQLTSSFQPVRYDGDSFEQVNRRSFEDRQELEKLERERLEFQRLENERLALEQEQRRLDQLIKEQLEHEALVQKRLNAEAALEEQIKQEKHIMEQIRQEEQQNEQADFEQHYQEHFNKSMSAASIQSKTYADIALAENADLLSSEFKQITLEAYNDPQFKAMLELLMKPFNVPVEKIEQDAEWPSQDKIGIPLLRLIYFI